MQLNDLIRKAGDLVSLPEVYYRAQELLDDPRSDSKSLGNVLETDPNLTARVLRTANSPLYSPQARVDRLSYAVTLLGRGTLRDIILSTCVLRAFSKLSIRLVDLSTFWHHSLYCGLVARELAKARKMLHSERMLIAGLLHDIGQLVMYQTCPEMSEQVLEIAECHDDGMYQAEREIFGFTHADLGAALLQSWRLPESLQEAVYAHHEPALAGSFCIEAALVYLGNALANQIEPGRHVDTWESRIDPKVWEMAGLAEEVAEAAMTDANDCFLAALDALMPGAMIIG